jgi:hypothetical protein
MALRLVWNGVRRKVYAIAGRAWGREVMSGRKDDQELVAGKKESLCWSVPAQAL